MVYGFLLGLVPWRLIGIVAAVIALDVTLAGGDLIITPVLTGLGGGLETAIRAALPL